jgi:hypothetical protein
VRGAGLPPEKKLLFFMGSFVYITFLTFPGFSPAARGTGKGTATRQGARVGQEEGGKIILTLKK